MKNSILFFLTLGVVIATACKKTNHGATVDPNLASFANMQEHIFKHSCNSAGCHNLSASSNVQHGLALEGSSAYSNLVGKTPKNAQAIAAGLKLVMPGSADSSFLYTKCNWQTYKYGSQMPLGANALSANEVLFIKQWINAGAPQTGVVADYKLLTAH
jgi:hypothetical protein